MKNFLNPFTQRVLSILALSVASTSVSHGSAFADTPAAVTALSSPVPEPAANAAPSRKLLLSGDLNADYFVTVKGSNGQDSLRFRKFEFYLSQNISDNIRLAIVTKLDQDFRADGRTDITKTQLSDLIKEAYIEIKNVGGKPVAVIFGMSEIAWGQDHHGMPIFNNTPMHEQIADADHDQVLGVTVTLDQNNILGYFDKAEASFFETDGSLKIGTFDGFSLRLSKQLTDRITLENSFLYKGNQGLDKARESRQSVGFVYESGKYTAWVEGVLFQGNDLYPGSHSALTVGVTKKLRRGKITVESTWVTHSLTDLGLGYFYDINKNTTIGPEIRIRNYNHPFSDDGQVVIAGARYNVRF